MTIARKRKFVTKLLKKLELDFDPMFVKLSRKMKQTSTMTNFQIRWWKGDVILNFKLFNIYCGKHHLKRIFKILIMNVINHD